MLGMPLFCPFYTCQACTSAGNELLAGTLYCNVICIFSGDPVTFGGWHPSRNSDPNRLTHLRPARRPASRTRNIRRAYRSTAIIEGRYDTGISTTHTRIVGSAIDGSVLMWENRLRRGERLNLSGSCTAVLPIPRVVLLQPCHLPPLSRKEQMRNLCTP